MSPTRERLELLDEATAQHHLAFGLLFCAGLILPSTRKCRDSSIYAIRLEGPSWVIALVLLFVTSPAEEIFWRGFIQRHFMEKMGDLCGWLAASAVYAAIYISSGNIMLVLAALVAGLFWGWLYMKTRDLRACILSHALWTVAVFILWPLA